MFVMDTLGLRLDGVLLTMDFDVSYTINPHSLREEANNPAEIQQAIALHVEKAATLDHDPLLKIRHLGMAGSLARIVHALDLAEDYLTEAVRLSEQSEHPLHKFINQIRLANVYQWQGRFDLSTALFEALLEAPLSEYEDFLLQHAGKNAFDQGAYDQALSYFQQALKIREDKGSEELIQSTEMALAETKRRL